MAFNVEALAITRGFDASPDAETANRILATGEKATQAANAAKSGNTQKQAYGKPSQYAKTAELLLVELRPNSGRSNLSLLVLFRIS